jgi:hypothetical protein
MWEAFTFETRQATVGQLLLYEFWPTHWSISHGHALHSLLDGAVSGPIRQDVFAQGSVQAQDCSQRIHADPGPSGRS